MAVCGDFSSTEAECDVVIVLNVVFAIFFFPIKLQFNEEFYVILNYYGTSYIKILPEGSDWEKLDYLKS